MCVCNSANDTGFEGDMEINKGLIYPVKSVTNYKTMIANHPGMKCDSHVEK